MDWSACPAVDRDPCRVGGAWCFARTRVTVASFFDHLDRGGTIDEFLEWFPSVGPDQVHAVLAVRLEVAGDASGRCVRILKYRWQIVYIRHILTPDEYAKGKWKL